LTHHRVLVILCGIEWGARESVLKFNKISLGILVLVYLFSVGICPLDFNHTNGHAKKDNVPDIHCGTALNSCVFTDNGGYARLDLTSSWKLCSLIVEPRLPVLVYSILKIPKSS